jgi:putative transposase
VRESVEVVVATLQPEGRHTMTEDRLALFELIDQSADNDLVRDMLAFAAGRLMERDVEAHTGAAPGARSADRKAYRNGYRERAWGEAG